jgi:AcrR family transcriptional regulator
MARTPGARNADYEESRLALARRVREGLLQEGEGVRTSLREMAALADTSVATLKHYFATREGVLQGVMESALVDGAPYMAMNAQPSGADARESLLTLLGNVHEAWHRFGVGKLQAFGLAAGLTDGTSVGPAYVQHMLEPLLQMAEARLQRHVEKGELPEGLPVRMAALQLLSPVVFALLHQDSLSGSRCRPLDVPALLPAHVDAFLRAYPPPPAAAAARKA